MVQWIVKRKDEKCANIILFWKYIKIALEEM